MEFAGRLLHFVGEWDYSFRNGVIGFEFMRGDTVCLMEGKYLTGPNGAMTMPGLCLAVPPIDKAELPGLVPVLYRLEKDSLVLCYQRDGGTRPMAFKTQEGTTLTLMTLQRQKK